MATSGTSCTMRAAATAAIASAAVPALPFATSGSRVRSGYALIRTAWSAGLLPEGLGRVAVVALALLPLLAAAALVAVALRVAPVVATLAAMAGVVTSAAGIAVLRAPLDAEFGAPGAVGVGFVSIGVAILSIAKR